MIRVTFRKKARRELPQNARIPGKYVSEGPFFPSFLARTANPSITYTPKRPPKALPDWQFRRPRRFPQDNRNPLARVGYIESLGGIARAFFWPWNIELL